MERFLIGAVGAVAVILALILAAHYRTRGQSSAATSRKKSVAALGAAAGVVVVGFLVAAGFAAFEWRSLAAQRRALVAQQSVLADQERALKAQQASAYPAPPRAEEPAAVSPQARQTAPAPPPPKQVAPVAHRARLAATASLGGALIIKAGEISLAARYRLENKGDAPAAGMQVGSAVMLRSDLDVRAAEEAVCGRLAGGPDTRPAVRRPLPAQQSIALNRIEGSGMAIGRGRLMRVASAGLKFWWVGCVAYHTLGAPDQYRSSFVYRIAESDGGARRLVPIRLADQIIPKDRLVIIPYRGAGISPD